MNARNLRLFCAFSALSSLAAPAHARSAIEIAHPRLRMNLSDGQLRGYFAIADHSALPTRLMEAASPGCARIEMQKAEGNGFVAVRSVPIPPYVSRAFGDAGLRFICVGAAAAAARGGTVTIIFRFDDDVVLSANFELEPGAR